MLQPGQYRDRQVTQRLDKLFGIVPRVEPGQEGVQWQGAEHRPALLGRQRMGIAGGMAPSPANRGRPALPAEAELGDPYEDGYTQPATIGYPAEWRDG